MVKRTWRFPVLPTSGIRIGSARTAGHVLCLGVLVAASLVVVYADEGLGVDGLRFLGILGSLDVGVVSVWVVS